MSMVTDENPEFEYRLDMECPACGESTDIGEATDGDMYNCRECDADLLATAHGGGIMRFHLVDKDEDEEQDR